MTRLAPTDLKLPFLTAEMPGIGGVIKSYDEDFFVEEVPLYDPSGDGTHCYFTIEKHGLTTPAAIRMIAATLGRPPRDVGYAGLKDAHGVTRQRLSIEHIDPGTIESLDLSRIKVLGVDRHTNKIKLGHLRGNRFVIRIREVGGSAKDRAEPILDVLAGCGVPNYFGPQRFGVRADNADIGKAVLREDYDEAIALMLGRPTAMDSGDSLRARELFDKGDLSGALAAWPSSMASQKRVCRTLLQSDGDSQRAWRAVDHSMRKFYISALQSDLFNHVLARRIERLNRLEDGDVAWKHRNGACFLVEDCGVEQPRCDAFEISPTGPLFGKKMKEPSGQPAEVERAVLESSGLLREQIRVKDGSKLDGARRPLRVPLEEPSLSQGEDAHGSFIEVSFSLPPGAYATCVTREICKNAAP